MRVLLLSRLLLLSFLVLGAWPAQADPATERYAPAQLRVANDLLESARAAAVRGDSALAGKLAWQASFDARLAYGMSESEQLRAEAAKVGGEASALIKRLAAAR